MPAQRASGPVALDGPAARQEQLAAARWVADFVSSGYGPGGGCKLLADDAQPTWVRSAAVALAAAPLHHPAVAPYRDLARRVQQSHGDQSTASILLAARLVAGILEADPNPRRLLPGLTLARRQALAAVDAQRGVAPPEAALSHLAGPDAAQTVLEGLRGLGPDLDLDAIDVRAEERADIAWAEGIVAPDLDGPKADGSAKVLLLSAPWTFKPRREGLSIRLAAGSRVQDWHDADRTARDASLDWVRSNGIGLVACTTSVDDALADALRSNGVLVWTDCPRSAMDRLAKTTRARPVARALDARPTDLGRAHWRRRPRAAKGWLIVGRGPAATLLVPAHNAPSRDAAVESAEQLLRTAGAVLDDPGSLPGAGQWQRHVAASLRQAANAAPARGPLAFGAAAAAFDLLADDLVRNQGHDPQTWKSPDGNAVLDPATCVRHAVAAAFDLAGAVLRLDGRYAKRASAPASLRGGLGPAGSPRGLPGDLPPLM